MAELTDLLGVVVGGLLGFGSAYLMQVRSERIRKAAIRRQIFLLLRTVEFYVSTFHSIGSFGDSKSAANRLFGESCKRLAQRVLDPDVAQALDEKELMAIGIAIFKTEINVATLGDPSYAATTRIPESVHGTLDALQEACKMLDREYRPDILLNGTHVAPSRVCAICDPTAVQLR